MRKITFFLENHESLDAVQEYNTVKTINNRYEGTADDNHEESEKTFFLENHERFGDVKE